MAKSLEKKKERDRKRSPYDRSKRESSFEMPLSKENYLFIALGFLVIIVGYILIAVESSVDGFLSLNISPVLIIAGFVWIIYSILYKPKEKSSSDRNTSAR